MMRVDNLSVFFGRTIALDTISTTFEPGITGVFGPNGSGKSTLLRVAAGLLRPSRGAVYLHDRALGSFDEARAARIGYVGHSAGLYARLTVRENLDLFGKLYGAPSARPGEMIDALGLRSYGDTRTAELSSGLKRRAAVARAMVHDPDLLMLDEPYANVDDEAAELMSAALRAWRSPGRLALVATHGAKKLKAFADGGLILRRGQVAVHGRYRERAAAGSAT